MERTACRRKRFLFGFTSVPFPLRADGVSVRYLPILRHLAQRHDIDLLVVSGGSEDLPRLQELRGLCRRISVLPHPRCAPSGCLAKVRTYAAFLLPPTAPLSVVAHGGRSVTRRILEATKREQYDSIVWVGADLLPYLIAALPSMSFAKLFVDFIDSPALWSVRGKAPIFRNRLLDRYERWKTAHWEAGVARRADATIYISPVDAAAAGGKAGNGAKRVVPNGINVPSMPDSGRAPLPSPNIGFLGNMGYQPNIEAAEWLYHEIFTPLKERRPDLHLIVIGRNPSPSIRKIGDSPGVIVTGGVEDVWPYVNAVDVFLFPLLRGAGLKNKILEAMFAGKPVLTTEIGNEGIDAVPGNDFVLCRTPEDFRREAACLLDDPGKRERIGRSCSAFIREKFTWGPILEEYEELVAGTVPATGAASAQ